MKKLLTTKEVNDFKLNGAVVLRKKFDVRWIEKLVFFSTAFADKQINKNKVINIFFI